MGDTESNRRSAEAVEVKTSRRFDVDRLATWLTLAANLSVLVGILFLAIEIRQNTEMMRTQIHQSRSEQAMSEAQSVYNSAHAPALLAKARVGEELSGEETIRYEFLFRSFHRNWDNQYRQFREGFLGENIPRSLRAAILSEIGGSPHARALWEKTKSAYGAEYSSYVDSVLVEVPPPKRR